MAGADLLHGTCRSGASITTKRVMSTTDFEELAAASDGYIHLWVGSTPPNSPSRLIANSAIAVSLETFAQGDF
jgi:hypothetical protein